MTWNGVSRNRQYTRLPNGTCPHDNISSLFPFGFSKRCESYPPPCQNKRTALKQPYLRPQFACNPDFGRQMWVCKDGKECPGWQNKKRKKTREKKGKKLEVDLQLKGSIYHTRNAKVKHDLWRYGPCGTKIKAVDQYWWVIMVPLFSFHYHHLEAFLMTFWLDLNGRN